jgi:hypothetical protein
MFDLPPDLPRLRTLELWHHMWLTRIQAAITEAEAEQRRQEQAARQAPPPTGWKLQRGIDRDRTPMGVHQADCGLAKGPGITRDQARRLLADGVEACAVCRPDIELGVLE